MEKLIVQTLRKIGANTLAYHSSIFNYDSKSYTEQALGKKVENTLAYHSCCFKSDRNKVL